MIARVWQGKTKNEYSEIYKKIIEDRDIPYYSEAEGFVKLTFLKRTQGQFTYFKLITFWKDLSAIKSFAGPNFEKAVAFEDDEKYVVDFPGDASHYDIFAE